MTYKQLVDELKQWRPELFTGRLMIFNKVSVDDEAVLR